MRKLLAAALVCVATAAGAQSYDDRAAAERAAADLKSLDDAQMAAKEREQRKAEVAADRKLLAERETPVPWGGILLVAAVAGVWILAKRPKRPNSLPTEHR